jgi:Bacterial pre-peptidase C-terminal domain
MSPKSYFKLTALSLAMLLLSATSARAQETEPNNTFEQATLMPVDASFNGAITVPSDTDWYKFTTPEDGGVFITLENGVGTGNKTLTWYNNDGVTVFGSIDVSSDPANNFGPIMFDFLGQGTYFLRVTETNSDTSGPYVVKVNLSVTGTPNDIEPNDISSQALGLPLNGSKQGHIGYLYNNVSDSADWYKLTTNADGNLLITLDAPFGGSKRLSIYDGDATTLLNTIDVGDFVGTIEQDAIAQGIYYIKISSLGGYSFAAYTISDSLITVKQNNDNEPNNNFSTAEILPLNHTTTGHIGYYSNHQKDTSDWYKINLNTSGSLKLLLTGPGADYFTVNLYDIPGTHRLASATIGNGAAGFQISSIAAGIYYARVEGTSGNGSEFGPYTLTDSFFTTLPVTLIDFDGKLAANTAFLSWRTTAEINNKGFTVQKSTDGQNFSDIGFVAGKGNSQVTNNYSFTDVKVLSGSNYYRLKQINIDNNFNYSSIIKINYSRFDWAILANPLRENSSIQLQLDIKERISVQIFSSNGKLIQSVDKGELSPGTYSIPLHLGNVSAGSYVVKLKVGNRSYTKMISK